MTFLDGGFRLISRQDFMEPWKVSWSVGPQILSRLKYFKNYLDQNQIVDDVRIKVMKSYTFGESLTFPVVHSRSQHVLPTLPTRWIGTKLCTEVHGPRRMNPHHCSILWLFPLPPPWVLPLWWWVKQHWYPCPSPGLASSPWASWFDVISLCFLWHAIIYCSLTRSLPLLWQIRLLLNTWLVSVGDLAE